MQTFTPSQYIMIAIANAFGLDKESWTDRLEWVHDHEDELEQHTQAAEEPAQYMAAVMAYRKTQRGEATGYLCGLDATASGLQLLAVLSGCPLSASICNVINTGTRQDAYTRVYQRVCEILQTTGTVSRKALKAALMTHLYGSKLEPIKAFGEDTAELKAFYQAIDEMLPGANTLNHDLISLWQSDALVHSWVLPDGVDVVVKVMDKVERPVSFLGQTYTVSEQVNRPKEKGLSMGANIIHSLDGMVVREMNRRCNYDVNHINGLYNMLQAKQGGQYTLREQDLSLLRVLELYEQTKFMSAVVLEYLDEYNAGHLANNQRAAVLNLLESMPGKPFKLLCVHDCFKFHANYGNDVRQQYINLLAEIGDSEILSSIATQVRGKVTTVNKISNNLSNMIRLTEYALS